MVGRWLKNFPIGNRVPRIPENEGGGKLRASHLHTLPLPSPLATAALSVMIIALEDRVCLDHPAGCGQPLRTNGSAA
jgi:hypothetical protein